MAFDMHSLAITLSLGLLTQSLALAAQFVLNRRTRGLGRWAWGSLALSVGFVLTFFRDAPVLGRFAIVGGNLFLVGGLLLFVGGITAFLGRPTRSWILLGAFAAVGLESVVFTFGADDPTLRRFFLSLVISLVCLALVPRLLSAREAATRASRRFLAGVFLLHGIFYALRAGSALVHPLKSLFEASGIEVATYLETFLASMFWTFGLSLLMNQRLGAGIEEEERSRRLVFETIPDAVTIVRLRDKVFVDVNRGFCEALGYTREEILGRRSDEVGVWRDLRERDRLFAALAAQGHLTAFASEFSRKDGSVLQGEVSSRIISFLGEAHVVSVTRDVSARRRSEERIKDLIRQLEVEKNYAERLSLTDGLTRIANRKRFDEALTTEFLRHRRSLGTLSLIMLDIDHFKAYNDHYGHPAGDECLKKVAAVLEEVVGRGPDLVCRYGGEEFCVLLPDTDEEGAVIVAERLKAAVEGLGLVHEFTETGKVVTVSLGLVSVDPLSTISATEVVMAADEALYAAKQGGRNRVARAAARCSVLAKGGKADFLKLVWSPNYECLNPIIDVEHRNLVEDTNRLLGAWLGGGAGEGLSAAVLKLVGDIEGHFKDEEGIIGEAGFPGVEEHRRVHEGLLAATKELAARCVAGDLDFSEFYRFVSLEVVSQHLFTEDRKYFPYL